jgi:hypothetical protein
VLTIVIGLQFVQTIAALYLPSLNADIVDTGSRPATPGTSGVSGC